MSTFKIGICQIHGSSDKNINYDTAKKAIEVAVSKEAQLIVLPEMWICPYNTKLFREYSEPIPSGQTCKFLSCLAKENKVYIIGGSIPEIEESSNKIYNTSPIFSPDGSLIGKHRKIHLFDVDIVNGISFHESETLSPGNDLTIVNTKFCKIGIGICFDMRFSELALAMRNKGCELIVYPGAFNMCTGPQHWELLLRSRSIDGQCFVVGCAPARNSAKDSCYVSWGHSMLVDPWGKVLKVSECEENIDDIIVLDINLEEVKKVRESIPVLKNKRDDLYELNWKK